MVRSILATSLLAIVLAGCNSEPAATSAQDVAAADAGDSQTATGAPATSESCVQDVPFYSPLPDDSIHFDLPFRVARDRVYSSDDGTTRRGLSLEYLEGGAEQAWNSILEAMRAAGYEPTDTAANAPNSGNFTKSGQPSIFIKVDQDPGQHPTGDDVVGSIWMSWAVQGEAASVQDTSGSAG